ncbi:PLDc N-terminal domain-containing protein [Steroidobacter sp. S1-65]|uniref:PLDc N-terminal domain-containing protein n=1 Tax=Steroidobacter gossypii TaxID=2805490 RepID=A0ABS1WUC2_9GAMM|nr:phospholipase D-like domain-containing protein [Steroidobacter gossypii]MBM0104571.1 PLDc N-terminal domain-containing protein [Steroidobacter gossypii]
MIVDWLPTPSQHFLVSAVALLVYILTSRASEQRRAPTSAIAWVLGLSLLPYLVLPLYLLFGQRKLKPVAIPYAGVVVEGPHWAAELIESFGLAPPSICKIRMHADGVEARAALFKIIDEATRTLDVSTFIIGNDAFGSDIVARLARRAREGVEVRLMLDGFFAILAPRRYKRELTAAGAKVAVFRPFFSFRRLGPRNLRNHRKLVVADDRYLWCGGRNLAAEYFLGDARGRIWPDLSFDLEGPVAVAAGRQFDLDWSTTHPRLPLRERQAVTVEGGELAQFLPSGPDQVEDTAQSLLIDGCYRARRRLLIVTPYFVPDDSLRAAMRLAARRGVKVTIAIPQRSNHLLADFVRSRPMRDLAAAGVEFRLLPQMVHAKAVVIDETLAMCGSINLDLRSLLLNHEAAVVFYGRPSIDWLAQWIAATAEQGYAYRAEPPSLLRDIAEGVLLTVAFQL